MYRKQKTTAYVFDVDRILSHAQNPSCLNQSAYALLYQALQVCGTADGRPCSRQQALQMKALIRQAREAQVQPGDALLQTSLGELRHQVDWALRRHWNLSWFMIFGVLFTAFLLRQCAVSHTETVNSCQADVRLVEGWTPRDTAVTLETLTDDCYDPDRRLHDAPTYKLNRLYRIKRAYLSTQRSAEEEEAALQSEPDETRQAEHQRRAERLRQVMAEHRAEYDAVNARGFTEIQGQALEEVQGALHSHQSGAAVANGWMWFFLLLIPLYVFATRPYGYQVNANVAHARRLHAIRRFGLLIAGGLGAASAALYFTETVTRWSDGSVTREPGSLTIFIIVFKILLLLAAVLVLCLTACLLMFYATVYGLLNYYDWKRFIGLRRH